MLSPRASNNQHYPCHSLDRFAFSMSVEFSPTKWVATSEAHKPSDPAFATTSILAWPSPPETIRLEMNQIHLWCAAMSDFEAELEEFLAMLSPEEWTRAEKFRFSKDRNQYIIRHGILRVLLGRYLGLPASNVSFSHGALGKPEIKADLIPDYLHFNASHSGNLALFVVTYDSPVGVDVEYLRLVPDFAEIASRFFSPRETEALMALPIDRRIRGFFAYWTRKEAILKATGQGIGEGLAKVEVALPPWQEVETRQTVGESEDRREWQLRSFSPAPGYLGALAFRNHNVRLSQWKVHAPLH
jgi:4'-phosphopantetheinyl transferase